MVAASMVSKLLLVSGLVDSVTNKPQVLLFISHDCPICNAYAPEIGRLEAKFGKAFQFRLVYCDLKLTQAEAKAHAKEFGISNAAITVNPSEAIAKAYKATVTPQAVVVDSAGKAVYSGRIDDRYLSLGQQRPAPALGRAQLRGRVLAPGWHRGPRLRDGSHPAALRPGVRDARRAPPLPSLRRTERAQRRRRASRRLHAGRRPATGRARPGRGAAEHDGVLVDRRGVRRAARPVARKLAGYDPRRVG